MEPEEILRIAIRTRVHLTAAFLGFVALLVICGTVITCTYIDATHPKKEITKTEQANQAPGADEGRSSPTTSQ